MNMVERVATAISNAMAEHGATPIWSDRMARAAIEAMREPSAEMVKDGLEKPRGMIDCVLIRFRHTTGEW